MRTEVAPAAWEDGDGLSLKAPREADTAAQRGCSTQPGNVGPRCKDSQNWKDTGIIWMRGVENGHSK